MPGTVARQTPSKQPVIKNPELTNIGPDDCFRSKGAEFSPAPSFSAPSGRVLRGADESEASFKAAGSCVWTLSSDPDFGSTALDSGAADSLRFVAASAELCAAVVSVAFCNSNVHLDYDISTPLGPGTLATCVKSNTKLTSVLIAKLNYEENSAMGPKNYGVLHFTRTFGPEFMV